MVKKISILFITLLLFICTSLPVFATSLDDYFIFNTKYSRPAVTENNGYLEVLLRNKNTNVHYSRIYFWSIQSKQVADIDNYMGITMDGSSVNLTPRGTSGSNYSLFCIKPLNDSLQLVGVGPCHDQISISVTDSSSALEVVSLRAYGNYLFYGTDSVINTDVPFVINYGNDINVTFESMLEELKEIDIKIGTISNILSNHGMTFELIASYLLDIGLTLDEIYNLLLNSSNSDVTDESTNSNDVLDDVVTEYEDIEGGFVDDFTDSIGNLPAFDFNGITDFQTTSRFIALQMQNIFDSSEYIRFIFTACLTFGIALILIGRGSK